LRPLVLLGLAGQRLVVAALAESRSSTPPGVRDLPR
jgi:hypothetical protein